MIFKKETYISRRIELLKKVGKGIIVLPGNTESPRNFKANTYFFVQDSSFLYYTGINEPNLVLVLNCDTGESIIFGDEASLEHNIWMGSKMTLQEVCKNVGINNVFALNKLFPYCSLSSLKIHYLPPYRSETIIFLSKLLGTRLDTIEANISVDLIKAIVSQREIKSSEEIQELDKALNLTRKMHLEVMNNTKVGQKESNLVGILESISVSQGSRTAYPPIVSVQGQILHNFNYTNVLKEGELLLGDFGASSISGYAGDITRTIPTSGKFSNKQKEIYQIVLEAQKKAINMLKPDILFKDVHLASSISIVEGLKDLGLMRGNTEEAVQKGAHALFFPHGLGHMIGLDVHDMENLGENYVGYDDEVLKSAQFGLKSLRLGKKLKEGFVLTVEPGIYFIPELFYDWKQNNKQCAPFLNFDKIESYLDFGGIRVEDEYVISKNGNTLIGEYIPKEISELEEIMRN
jgi:Xaa-Pro aminopeptidase